MGPAELVLEDLGAGDVHELDLVDVSTGELADVCLDRGCTTAGSAPSWCSRTSAPATCTSSIWWT
jgi:hypothetical protein